MIFNFISQRTWVSRGVAFIWVAFIELTRVGRLALCRQLLEGREGGKGVFSIQPQLKMQLVKI